MNDYTIKKFIKKLDDLKDSDEDREYLEDLTTINDMIDGNKPVDFEVINKILNKYKVELDYLYKLEEKLRPYQRINYIINNQTENIFNFLKTLRHSLLRIGAMHYLKRAGKEMIKDKLINNDNEYLYNEFVRLLEL